MMKRRLKRTLDNALFFIRHESASCVILLGAAVIAMILANSGASEGYMTLLSYTPFPALRAVHLDLSLLGWINDGLMALFFFLVGMEIKREMLYGELNTPSAMMYPVCAALGGMVVPALLYLAVNAGGPGAGGWGIPMATDIAFALGIMGGVARRAPLGLVIFLTALAVVDDLGAIVVIALFYSTHVAWIMLGTGLLAIAFGYLLNRRGCQKVWPYLFCGFIAWFCFLNGGVHPTIAGVCAGMILPATEEVSTSLLHKLEHRLAPWSAFLIMPVFALANAGVPLEGGLSGLLTPVGMGIILGLCVGKPLGIVSFVLLMGKISGTPWPGKAKIGELIATGCLGGIGFTMSIFIASLAFTDIYLLQVAKLSILTASIISAIIGTILFSFCKRKEE